MAPRKPKGIDDRLSRGRIIRSSENVFEIETHTTRNLPDVAQKEDLQTFVFTKKDSIYFKPQKLGSQVRVVFNSFEKEYVERIYNSGWDLIYSKY